MNFRKIIQNDYVKKFQLPKIESKIGFVWVIQMP